MGMKSALEIVPYITPAPHQPLAVTSHNEGKECENDDDYYCRNRCGWYIRSLIAERRVIDESKLSMIRSYFARLVWPNHSIWSYHSVIYDRIVVLWSNHMCKYYDQIIVVWSGHTFVLWSYHMVLLILLLLVMLLCWVTENKGDIWKCIPCILFSIVLISWYWDCTLDLQR